MKIFAKLILIFMVFTVGTAAVIHADRQCAAIGGNSVTLTGKLENFIEKQVDLL